MEAGRMSVFLMLLTLFCGLHGSSLFRIGGGHGGLTMSDEKRLIKHLTENYGKIGIVGRPVYNTSESARVNLGVALIQILGADEKSETIKLKLWERHLWKDILLQWSPADFGGIDNIPVPSSQIWTPDIVLYNGKGKEIREAIAVVSYDGTVLWIPRVEVEIPCSRDIERFPNDEQTCILKYASWTYDGFKLDVNFYDGLEEIDISDFRKSSEWHLLGHQAVKNVKYYPCCEEPYPDLTFTLSIKRNAVFYNFALITPSVLLSSLILLIFLMPRNKVYRNCYGSTIFASFLLLLLILAEVMPHGMTQLPVIGRYLLANMILLVIAMFLSCFITILHNYSGNKSTNMKLGRMFFATKNKRSDDDEETLKTNGKMNGQPEKTVSAPNPDSWKRLATLLDGTFFLIFLVIELALTWNYIF